MNSEQSNQQHGESRSMRWVRRNPQTMIIIIVILVVLLLIVSISWWWHAHHSDSFSLGGLYGRGGVDGKTANIDYNNRMSGALQYGMMGAGIQETPSADESLGGYYGGFGDDGSGDALGMSSHRVGSMGMLQDPSSVGSYQTKGQKHQHMGPVGSWDQHVLGEAPLHWGPVKHHHDHHGHHPAHHPAHPSHHAAHQHS